MDSFEPIEMGERIKKQRLLLGLSREQLAEAATITPRYLYDLELGLKNCSLDTLCRVSSALQISVDYLLFGETKKSPAYLPVISLIEQCPLKQLPHLEQIISHYIQAIGELQ